MNDMGTPGPYGAGFADDGFRAILHANRAAALQAMRLYCDAVMDCCASHALDPTYLRALQRRADAYLSMGDWPNAVKDLEALVGASRLRVHPRFTPGSPQVDPARFYRLKLKYEKLLSNFALNCNMRPCTSAPHMGSECTAKLQEAKRKVGPGRKCSKCQMMEFNSRIDGLECV